MIPPLVRLPTTRLDHGALDDLAALAVAMSAGRVVVVGDQRDEHREALDAFVVATALAARRPEARLGIAARVGAGREASLLAREATAAQLLGACEVLVLEGDESACRDAATIIEALFTEGSHTVETPTARVDGARNLPPPSVDGGPPVLWRAGATLWRLHDGEPARVGEVVVTGAAATLPAPVDGVLVELTLAEGPPSSLAAAVAT